MSPNFLKTRKETILILKKTLLAYIVHYKYFNLKKNIKNKLSTVNIFLLPFFYFTLFMGNI